MGGDEIETAGVQEDVPAVEASLKINLPQTTTTAMVMEMEMEIVKMDLDAEEEDVDEMRLIAKMDTGEEEEMEIEEDEETEVVVPSVHILAPRVHPDRGAPLKIHDTYFITVF